MLRSRSFMKMRNSTVGTLDYIISNNLTFFLPIQATFTNTCSMTLYNGMKATKPILWYFLTYFYLGAL